MNLTYGAGNSNQPAQKKLPDYAPVDFTKPYFYDITDGRIKNHPTQSPYGINSGYFNGKDTNEVAKAPGLAEGTYRADNVDQMNKGIPPNESFVGGKGFYSGGSAGAAGNVNGTSGGATRTLGYIPGGDNAPSGTGSGYMDELVGIERQRFNEQKGLVNDLRNQASPYDTNSEAWKKHLAASMNNVTRRFNGIEARQRGSLTPTSTGMAGAMSAALDRGRYAALSDTENGLYSEAMKGNADFNMRKYQAALAGLGGSNLTGVLGGLAARQFGQQDADAKSQGDLMQLVSKLGVEGAIAFIKSLGGA